MPFNSHKEYFYTVSFIFLLDKIILDLESRFSSKSKKDRSNLISILTTRNSSPTFKMLSAKSCLLIVTEVLRSFKETSIASLKINGGIIVQDREAKMEALAKALTNHQI